MRGEWGPRVFKLDERTEYLGDWANGCWILNFYCARLPHGNGKLSRVSLMVAAPMEGETRCFACRFSGTFIGGTPISGKFVHDDFSFDGSASCYTQNQHEPVVGAQSWTWMYPKQGSAKWEKRMVFQGLFDASGKALVGELCYLVPDADCSTRVEKKYDGRFVRTRIVAESKTKLVCETTSQFTGSLTIPESDKYEGALKLPGDIKIGRGKVTFSNGDVLESEW